MRSILVTSLCTLSIFLFSCRNAGDTENATDTGNRSDYISERLAAYAPVRLTTDLSHLGDSGRKMIPLLIRAAQVMDTLFWWQSYGNPDSLLNVVKDENARKFILINYGPWDRLNNDTPFIAGVGKKPATANFYPHDMTKEELSKSGLKDSANQYSIIRRDSTGRLYSIPYHVAFREPLQRASSYLRQAAALSTEPQLKRYLNLRAEALVTDNYTASDIAWMDMKNNSLDIIIGPIENYEDALYNRRTAYEAYVLVKDKEWSQRLEKYVTMLPGLQQDLPVEAKYKAETPGTSSQLAVYDIVYYAGDCNSGGKTIAVNLPNDEELQKTKGTRRSQLKNAMQAKFDKILVPIAKEYIDPSQAGQVNFDAFLQT